MSYGFKKSNLISPIIIRVVFIPGSIPISCVPVVFIVPVVIFVVPVVIFFVRIDTIMIHLIGFPVSDTDLFRCDFFQFEGTVFSVEFKGTAPVEVCVITGRLPTCYAHDLLELDFGTSPVLSGSPMSESSSTVYVHEVRHRAGQLGDGRVQCTSMKFLEDLFCADVNIILDDIDEDIGDEKFVQVNLAENCSH